VKRTTVKLPDELDGRLRHEAERRGMLELKAGGRLPSVPAGLSPKVAAVTGGGRGLGYPGRPRAFARKLRDILKAES
jgi:hypothetical protein